MHQLRLLSKLKNNYTCYRKIASFLCTPLMRNKEKFKKPTQIQTYLDVWNFFQRSVGKISI